MVEIIRPGQSFGEALMFLDKPYIVFAQALADSMLLHVPSTRCSNSARTASAGA